MKAKIFSIVLGLLVLFVIVELINIRIENVRNLDKQIQVIEQAILSTNSEKLALIREGRSIEAALASIPREILKGSEDPERQFVQFMDYINASDLKNMGGAISITQLPTYKSSPVPLEETRFEITLPMKTTRQLEAFLKYLLMQKDYPIKVEQLEIKRVPKKLPQVSLKAALLLPARMDLEQFSRTLKDTSS